MIEVKRGRRFARLDSDTYICGGSKGEFARLFLKKRSVCIPDSSSIYGERTPVCPMNRCC
ncbi:hypothetical protein ACFSQ7_19645 [Paenibacillus rhizoplanae]